MSGAAIMLAGVAVHACAPGGPKLDGERAAQA